MLITSPTLLASFEKACKETTIFNAQKEADFPKISEKDILCDKVLGRGAFSDVKEIKRIHLSQSVKGDLENDSQIVCNLNQMFNSREYMSCNCLRDGDARYALKKLTKPTTEIALLDLALEAKFLAVLCHPHIIKLRAIASVCPLDDNYFVILDRLYNTLDREIYIWRRKKKINAMINSLYRKGRRKEKMMTKRLTVAYDIASAMSMLHSKRVIFRDLAADNVGFDIRGEVKLFDFGLAKELNSTLKLADGNYRLTGYTGSLMFMAPEVVKYLPYNLSADVFSFGVILWIILSCSLPYFGWNVEKYEKNVVEKGYRPKLDKSWDKNISKLLEKCWASNPNIRPDFEEIKHQLKMSIMDLSAGKVELDIDKSNHSISKQRWSLTIRI